MADGPSAKHKNSKGYGHETRLRAETPACAMRFGESRHSGVQARNTDTLFSEEDPKRTR